MNEPARRDGITVGFDDSQEARHSLEWAVGAACRRETGLTVVHAYQVPVQAGPAKFGHVPDVLHDNSLGVLRHAQEHLAELGVSDVPHGDLHFDSVRGEAASVLIDRSRTSELTVVGSRGLRTFDRFLLGSVSATLSARAYGPVAVVPGSASAGRVSRVLVGIDVMDRDDHVLGFAFDEAARAAAQLLAVHVFDPDHGGARAADRAWVDRCCSDAREALVAVADRWGDTYPSVRWSVEVRSGRAAETLLAGTHADDLVVVGGRRHPKSAGWMLGSVPDRLLKLAPCAVIVEHEHD
ncbi:universal stress protein [Isoptericola aurantiacus]|uniref:universal stress protein n=1 Tax=Isoptericola aurantiacus TaxID=3377839 RepID=UPI00383B20F6